MCCSRAWESGEFEADGECPACGSETCEDTAEDICTYSPVVCDECGYAPCDGSC